MTWANAENAARTDASASKFSQGASQPSEFGPVISTEATWSAHGSPSLVDLLNARREELAAELDRTKARMNCKDASLIEAELRKITTASLAACLYQ